MLKEAKGMGLLAQFKNAATGVIILSLVFVSNSTAQSPLRSGGNGSGAAAHIRRPQFIRAFVVDDRLSSLRREPNLQSEIIHRLRLGRPVYITRVWSAGADQPRFYRVAVSRRTRGWIHESAVAMQGKVGEDQRIM